MQKLILIIIPLLLLLIAGCSGIPSNGQSVSIEQLFSNPQKYSGKTITVEGFYFHGFETIILAERLELSGYAEGHLVPKGNMVWVEGGIPIEIYNALPQQQMMGPTERIGKLRITGKFEYGGQYGHVGGFNSQITPSKVKLLPRTPPTS